MLHERDHGGTAGCGPAIKGCEEVYPLARIGTLKRADTDQAAFTSAPGVANTASSFPVSLGCRRMQRDLSNCRFARHRPDAGNSAVSVSENAGSLEGEAPRRGVPMWPDAEPYGLSRSFEDEPAAGAGGADVVTPVMLPTERRRRLVTCWLVHQDVERRIYAFCAMVTSDPGEFVERIVRRYGLVAVRDVRFSEGFDATTALATAMISDALAETLAFAAADPDSVLAAGLDVVVEQRFAA